MIIIVILLLLSGGIRIYLFIEVFLCFSLTKLKKEKNSIWQLIALCAGTGGSILVIGSASGVALMGLEKVDFLWYAKKVTLGASIGYFAGIATYLAQNAVLSGALLSGSVSP